MGEGHGTGLSTYLRPVEEGSISERHRVKKKFIWGPLSGKTGIYRAPEHTNYSWDSFIEEKQRTRCKGWRIQNVYSVVVVVFG